MLEIAPPHSLAARAWPGARTRSAARSAKGAASTAATAARAPDAKVPAPAACPAFVREDGPVRETRPDPIAPPPSRAAAWLKGAGLSGPEPRCMK